MEFRHYAMRSEREMPARYRFCCGTGLTLSSVSFGSPSRFFCGNWNGLPTRVPLVLNSQANTEAQQNYAAMADSSGLGSTELRSRTTMKQQLVAHVSSSCCRKLAETEVALVRGWLLPASYLGSKLSTP